MAGRLLAATRKRRRGRKEEEEEEDLKKKKKVKKIQALPIHSSIVEKAWLWRGPGPDCVQGAEAGKEEEGDSEEEEDSDEEEVRLRPAAAPKCALCGGAAAVHCASDEASLCWGCDAEIHSANFLVARHVRSLLCGSPLSSADAAGSSAASSSSSSSSSSNLHLCCHRHRHSHGSHSSSAHRFRRLDPCWAEGAADSQDHDFSSALNLCS